MRRVIAAVLVGGVLALAGCAGSSGSAAISEKSFLKAVSGIDSYASMHLDDSAVDDLAKGICKSLRSMKDDHERSTFLDLTATLVAAQGISQSDEVAFASAAIARYCPELAAKD